MRQFLGVGTLRAFQGLRQALLAIVFAFLRPLKALSTLLSIFSSSRSLLAQYFRPSYAAIKKI